MSKIVPVDFGGQKQPHIRRRLPKTHQDYWGSRLRKRSYEHRGVRVEIPEWQIRLQHERREQWFNLGTANKEQAAGLARDVYIFLKANGWGPTMDKFKPKVEKRDRCSVEEFCEICRRVIPLTESSPSRRSIESYIYNLRNICDTVKVRDISGLTNDEVRRFVRVYREKRLEAGAKPEKVDLTCNSVIRNARSLFRTELLREYEAAGIKVGNPFTGYKLKPIKMKGYTPLSRAVLDSLWLDAVKLRDGDPSAPDPALNSNRWHNPDFRKPQPGAYAILILELGLGLRRNEADKAQKDWLFNQDGRWLMQVRETPYFQPKDKASRVIPVEPLLYAAIEEVMKDSDSVFIVPGPVPKRSNLDPKRLNMRLDKDHRTLAAWLRAKGLSSDRPCHELRKEFGSYVATAFSLFHAQKLLGHSSPVVTSAVYAGLTDLPDLSYAKLQISSGGAAFISSQALTTTTSKFPAGSV